jgi:hypothetical protein
MREREGAPERFGLGSDVFFGRKNLFRPMFTAGTDTTTSTLEWVMAELLQNPETLKKV